MKQCPRCSAQNPDSAAICERCGADLRNVAPTSGQWSANAGRSDAAGPRDASAGYRGGQGGQGAAGIGSTFVDPSETVVAAIGTSYLQNYLSGGGISKSIGILTQKRFYYRGKNYAGDVRTMRSATQEGVVDLEDISFTMFTHVRHIGYLIVAILLTLAIVGVFFAVYHSPNGLPIFLYSFLPAIIFYILYFVKRTSVFQVCFPGGAFGFNIRWYPISDIRDFQKQLHLLKDRVKESV